VTTALTVRLEPATFSELYYLLLQFESRLEQANQQSQDLRRVSSPFGNTFLLVGAKPDANIPKKKISMVDSTKSRFAPYVMARLPLSHSRDSDRGAASLF
jgi:hypothetical protein